MNVTRIPGINRPVGDPDAVPPPNINPYGSFHFRPDLAGRYGELSNVTAPNGGNLKVYLGFLTDDTREITIGSGATALLVAYSTFERGMILARSDQTNPVVIYGEPYLHYRKQGGVTSRFGLPTSDTHSLIGCEGALATNLDQADIYYHPSYGSSIVYGLIRNRWMELNSIWGPLGFPLTDEYDIMCTDPDGQKAPCGRANRFEMGVIYWTANTGAWDVLDIIGQKYESDCYGPDGPLGFPVSGTEARGSALYNNFQHGLIVANPITPGWDVRVLKSLELRLLHVHGRGSGSIFGGGRDVFLRIKLRVEEREIRADVNRVGIIQEFDNRIPTDGDFGEDSGPRDIELLQIQKLTGGMRIVGDIIGYDSGWTDGSEEFEGDILGSYPIDWNISNMWGLNDEAKAWRGDFLAEFHTRAPSVFGGNVVRRDLFWQFHNMHIAELNHRQYAETFSDVVFDEFALAHLFNDRFYEWVYKGSANSGTCFGMCLEAIQARLDRSIFTTPLSNYGSVEPDVNSLVRHVVGVKHGYQLGDNMLRWFLDRFTTGDTHDPNQVYEQSRRSYQSGDYPMIALTSGYFTIGGHVVMPYEWIDASNGGLDETGVPCNVILVANPNETFTENPGLSSSSKIYIYPDRNEFRFQMGSEWWSGGGWSGGRMYNIPYRIVANQPATPFWDIVNLLASGVFILLGGDIGISQISDQNGRNLFKPNLAGRPRKWEDLEDRADHRIPNMAIIPWLDANRAIPNLIYAEQPGGSLTASVNGTGSSCFMAVATPVGHYSLEMNSSLQSLDVMHLKDIRTNEESLTFGVPRNGEPREISIRLSRPRSSSFAAPSIVFEASRLMVTPPHEVSFGLRNFGNSLEVRNTSSTQVDFQIRRSDTATGQMGTPANVTLQAGETRRFN